MGLNRGDGHVYDTMWREHIEEIKEGFREEVMLELIATRCTSGEPGE